MLKVQLVVGYKDKGTALFDNLQAIPTIGVIQAHGDDFSLADRHFHRIPVGKVKFCFHNFKGHGEKGRSHLTLQISQQRSFRSRSAANVDLVPVGIGRAEKGKPHQMIPVCVGEEQIHLGQGLFLLLQFRPALRPAEIIHRRYVAQITPSTHRTIL